VAPAAAFTVVPDDGSAPLAVTFTDTSSGNPAWWNWSFGDGGKSTEHNPVHTYGAPGSYTVVLEAGNTAGTSSASGSVTVRQAGVSYDEDRTVTPTVGVAMAPAATGTVSGGREPVVVYRTPVPGADPVDVYRLRARADAATTGPTRPPRTLSVSYEAAEHPVVTAVIPAAQPAESSPDIGGNGIQPASGSSGGSRGIVGRVIDGIFRVLSLFRLS
jgi:PKD repeat protein